MKPGDIALLLMKRIDEIYTACPFYGSRKIVIELKKEGHMVNRKRVQGLMREMGIAGIHPGPNTSRRNAEHKVFPYLLRGLEIIEPLKVWSTDITFIRLPSGFVYLVAIMDWFSRMVLSYRLSNSLEATFCLDALEEALKEHGKPEIFNTDQGVQFTCTEFVEAIITFS
jgi:putative transposase